MNKIGHKFYWLKSENSDGGVNQMPLKKHLARLVLTILIIIYWCVDYSLFSFIYLNFTPKKAEQPLRGIELQEKKKKKMKSNFENWLERTQRQNRMCLLTLDFSI